MVKAGKWLRNFLTGKKERYQEKEIERNLWPSLPQLPPPPPPTTPKEKKRRSFHQVRVEMSRKESFLFEELEFEPRRHSMAVVYPMASETICRSNVPIGRTTCTTIVDICATKIQAAFRSYLARKALRALKGLVKLQAVVRGFLVRKQAAATLRCMQALVTAQARARAQRIRVVEEVEVMRPWKESSQRRMITELKLRQFYDMQRSMEDNVKVVEMDPGQSEINTKCRKYNSMSTITQIETKEKMIFTSQKVSPSPSILTTSMSKISSQSLSSSSPKPRRIQSLEEIINMKEGSFPVSNGCNLFPNYMANTESWRAKARSQSAPRQRVVSSDQNQSEKTRRSFERKNSFRGTSVQQSILPSSLKT